MRGYRFLARIRVGLTRAAGRPVFAHTDQRCLVATGYCSRHPELCTRLTPDHRCCCSMLAHRHENWNHQRWPRVTLLIADESIVSLYHCTGRVFLHTVERLTDCCIQDIERIHGHDDQSSIGWPWTHHRISHGTGADGSSFEACLATCGGSSYDQGSVWGIFLDVLSDIQLIINVTGSCGQRRGV